MTSSLPARLAGEGLAPLWSRCWRAIARAGPSSWSAVSMRVPVDDDTCRRAVAGLLGRPVRSGTASVTVRLSDLDDILRAAGDGWDLVAVAETVAGPLPDRAGDAVARARAIRRALDDARRAGPGDAWFQEWLGVLAADGTMARLHGRGDLDRVTTVASVLALVPADALPLPILAARVTGDPKALSAGATANLAVRGLAVRSGEPMPRSAGQRRDLWEAVGVVPDDLASQVLVLNLPVRGVPVGDWLAGAAQAGIPFRVTLQQLSRSTVEVARARAVFVCENPAVLRVAAERFGPGSAPLVCTEGRPSVACMRLLALLSAGGCDLRYHGDFDWPGLRIAADVLARSASSPWRMGRTDYENERDRHGGTSPRLDGAPAPSPWDPELADAMSRCGSVLYEEDMIDALLDDLAPER